MASPVDVFLLNYVTLQWRYLIYGAVIYM